MMVWNVQVIYSFCGWVLILLLTSSVNAEDRIAEGSDMVKLPLSLVSVEAPGGYHNSEYVIDGNAETAFTFDWPNGGAVLVFDLGRACVVEKVCVRAGRPGGPLWVTEIWIGGEKQDIRLEDEDSGKVWGEDEDGNMRPLLGRSVNLVTRGGEVSEISLKPSVGRYIRIRVAAGQGAVSEIEVYGSVNHRAERHLLHWWGGDPERDIIDSIDYLSEELGATDVWIDKIDDIFTCTRPCFGFSGLNDSGALHLLRTHGIRYWLVDGEGLPGMVRKPEDLRDERMWQTTLQRAREVLSRAADLGFTGYVMDAENYFSVAEEAKAYYMEKDGLTYVSSWCFSEEFGLDGYYYYRGSQLGKILREVWGEKAVLIQYYIPLVYNASREGNFWWLKGIHDAGVQIWLGDEQSYGAGFKELYNPQGLPDYPEFCSKWFVNYPEQVGRIHALYPFADRVFLGLHPWLSSHGSRPLYLPKYLDEQLNICNEYLFGTWIYNGGTPHAGDPRKVLDSEVMKRFKDEFGITAQDYIDVFKKYPKAKTNPFE